MHGGRLHAGQAENLGPDGGVGFSTLSGPYSWPINGVVGAVVTLFGVNSDALVDDPIPHICLARS